VTADCAEVKLFFLFFMSFKRGQSAPNFWAHAERNPTERNPMDHDHDLMSA